MKCVDRSCVGRSEKWSDERVDRRNEGDRPEKWADRTVFMSGSEWETEKENSPCVECMWERCVECRSGLRNEWIEAWSFFARCVDHSLGAQWIGASQALCVCERAASNACKRAEWKMFEVKMRTELIFRLFCLILWSNWKYFQFDPIYRTYQTCYFPENGFWISFEVKTNEPLRYNLGW